MFTLIDLPYPQDALEPVISAQTLEFHHGKHLQAYVDNLNKLLPEIGLEDLPLEEIVRRAAAAPSLENAPAVFNNAGQVLNHNLYFTQFKPVAAPGTTAAACVTDAAATLLRQIEAQWGTFEAFQADFVAKGTGLFGSGWVWLSAAEDGTLHITQEPGAGNPVTRGLKPLLTFDVWEHAYYLDWQNRRAAHLAALWQIVDWEVVEGRYNDLFVF
jgi:Fe-Mn family superoxide dismutase